MRIFILFSSYSYKKVSYLFLIQSLPYSSFIEPFSREGIPSFKNVKLYQKEKLPIN